MSTLKHRQISFIFICLFFLVFTAACASASTDPTVSAPTAMMPPATARPALTPTSTPIPITPSNRGVSQLIYDDQMGALLLFSGQDYSGNGPVDDTWSWDGSTWTQLHPAHEPAPRTGAALAYDPATRQVVLFAGVSAVGNTPLIDDTWTWNGTDWAQQHPAVSPSARADANMAYDAATGQLVLFGGTNQPHVGLNDTWVWTGSNWVEQHPATVPSSVIGFGTSLVYDATTQKLVLFGGDDDSQALYDTWLWSGSNWVLQHPSTKPAFPTTVQGTTVGFERQDMVYNAATGQIMLMLMGGNDDGTIGVQVGWTWDGANWTQMSATGPDVSDGLLVYDGRLQTVFQLTSYLPHTSPDFDIKLWKWDGHAWSVVEYWGH